MRKRRKTLMPDRNIFCEMEWHSIVIFPCGAYIYILLHGFGIKLKLSSGVRASGEYNLLWHFPAAADWIISRTRLPTCTFTLGDVPQSTNSFSLFWIWGESDSHSCTQCTLTPMHALSHVHLFICKHCRYARMRCKKHQPSPSAGGRTPSGSLVERNGG